MADIKIGNLEIDNLKVGTLSVDALYIGDVKIYPSTTPPPTPTLKWVSYSEGDAILLEGEKIYGFRIPTQVFYDVTDNETNFEIDFNDGATAELAHCLFHYSYDGTMIFVIESQSITLDYDPQVDDYLEIIFSDYSSKQWYFGHMMYDIDEVTNFPFGMDFYEEDTPTPQTLQWVTFTGGDTIPSTLNVYGISGDSEGLMDTFSDSTEPFYIEPYRRTFDIYLLNRYYDQTDNVNYIFSDITWSGLGDYINFNTDKTVRTFPFKLYIYA